MAHTLPSFSHPQIQQESISRKEDYTWGQEAGIQVLVLLLIICESASASFSAMGGYFGSLLRSLLSLMPYAALLSLAWGSIRM